MIVLVKFITIIFIMKHDQVVSSIINNIISRSRRGSIDNIHTSQTQKIVEQYEEDNSQQEYIIQKKDLRDIIHKLVKQNVDKGEIINKMEREIAELKTVLRTYEKKIQFFMHNDQSKTDFEHSKEQVFKKCVEDLELQYNKNQQLEKQQKYMKQTLQVQIQEISKLKTMLIERNRIVPKLTLDEAKPITNIKKQVPKPFSTPNRQACKKLDSLPLINCESIEYSITDSPLDKDPTIHPFKLFKTQATKGYEQGEFISIPKFNGIDEKIQKKTESQVQINNSKIEQFTELQKKNKILRLLGEKCINLQKHISKLTRRLLGVQTKESYVQQKPLQLTKYEQDKRLLVEIQQQHKISASSSNIQQSGYFIVESQQYQ